MKANVGEAGLPTFVPGEPVSYQVDKAGSPAMLRQAAWVAAVADAAGRELLHPHLRFVVSSLKRGGHSFDIDNVAKPVLERIASHADSVWIEMGVGAAPGVHVTEEVPVSPPATDVTVYFSRPPTSSIRPTSAPSEIAGASVLAGPDQAVGLWLAFDDPDVSIGNFDFSGPIRSLIDRLWPLLGGEAHRPADHRIRELRIVRSANPAQRGVAAALWLMA